MVSSKLLLASQSPRRSELLQQIGVQFELVRVNVPEVRGENEAPEHYVERLAREKSAAGAALHADYTVLGADTIVVFGEQVLEKPIDEVDAVSMLMSLSGATHKVITSVALSFQQRQTALTNITDVTFRSITEKEALDYWQTGEPKDKAGGYGIQGLGAVFVESIRGSYSSVMGLPLFETQKLLREFGVAFWATCDEL